MRVVMECAIPGKLLCASTSGLCNPRKVVLSRRNTGLSAHSNLRSSKFKIKAQTHHTSQVGIAKPTNLTDSDIQGFVWPSPTDEIPFWKKEFPSWDANLELPSEQTKDSKLMHIVHVTAEMAPIAKVGGLGDVVTGLARACLSCGHTVHIMLPFYECIQKHQINDLTLITTYNSYHDGNWIPTNAYHGVVSGIPVIFLEPSCQFFKGRQVYGGSYNELEAYMFFSRACLEWMQVTGTQPDIIHVHEWQAGALPILYWDMYHHLSLKKPRIVLTIHNMEHYGECRQEQLSMCGLDGSLYATFDKAVDDRTVGHNPERLSLLKGGIVYSNAVVTVSPTYLKETLCSGWLSSTLMRNRDKYFGIVNGIDTTMWNPSTDVFLPSKFNVGHLVSLFVASPMSEVRKRNALSLPYKKKKGSLPQILAAFCVDDTSIRFLRAYPIKVTPIKNSEGKKLCKYYVQRGLGLASGDHVTDTTIKVPLVVCITRLVAQKGLHLITHAIKQVEELGGQMVVLGKAPDHRVEREFEDLADSLNQGPSIRILLMYSEELSHLLYAAADIVLVPSMYEPCGLAQMIGMRYGAVPVVRKTGGLADTVFDMDDESKHEMANGFVFEGMDEASLNCAIDRAFACYRNNPGEWNCIVKKVMKMDNSWNNTASKYIEIYESVTAS